MLLVHVDKVQSATPMLFQREIGPKNLALARLEEASPLKLNGV